MAPRARIWFCIRIKDSSARRKLLLTISMICFNSLSFSLIRMMRAIKVRLSMSYWIKTFYASLKKEENFWISWAIYLEENFEKNLVNLFHNKVVKIVNGEFNVFESFDVIIHGQILDNLDELLNIFHFFLNWNQLFSFGQFSISVRDSFDKHPIIRLLHFQDLHTIVLVCCRNF